VNLDVLDRDEGSLTGPRSGVIEEHQQRMVAAANGTTAIRFLNQRVDFGFVEVTKPGSVKPLEGNGAHAGTPGNVLRRALGDESREGVDRRQTLIARSDAALALLFHVGEEEADAIGREVFDAKFIHRLSYLAGNEGHQLAKRITIAVLCVARQIAFGNQMFNKEATDPRSNEDIIIDPLHFFEGHI
jgi:hypothetical protein